MTRASTHRGVAGAETFNARTPAFTLHDLVEALCEAGANDRQVVTAVVDLLRTDRVRLVDRTPGARLAIG